LDIEGIGSVVAEKLVESGLIKEWLDVFDLKVEELGALNLGTKEEPRIFGEKNAAKICEAARRARSLSLARWLLALGIEDAGETITYEVAKFHKDLEDVAASKPLSDIARLGVLYDELDAVSPFARENKPQNAEERDERTQRYESLKREILALGGELERLGIAKRNEKWASRLKEKESKATGKFLTVVGPKVAGNIVAYFHSEAGRQVLSRLVKMGINPPGGLKEGGAHLAGADLPFSGKTFVLTGTLTSMTRDKAGEEIRARGGSVTGAVSKNTDFLVAGAEAGSKLEKAKEIGVQIITEKEFLERLELKTENTEPKSPKQAQPSLL
jgi:DNA ligase (NAD+)